MSDSVSAGPPGKPYILCRELSSKAELVYWTWYVLIVSIVLTFILPCEQVHCVCTCTKQQ